MGFPQGCDEKIAKFPNGDIQWNVFLDVLARVVPDTTVPRGDKLIAKKRQK
jgi:hypothetical protein